MENNTYENKNPCLGCHNSWFVDANTSCHDSCEKYHLYQDRNKLIDYKNNINGEIAETFRQNLDEWRNDFLDFRQDLSDSEITVVYNLIEFLKNKC